ncbi:YjgF/Yer057c/UK114 family protein [Pandoravirus quercus]|uniref:YjgF/Yer057c/UK114 family protein n=2 Tax=Pandoravirus TaxID=2060084 RepID=A0A2U7UA05_9VIRU|nr:YjgF/Yer057c/UK114 family protein [Pandoravirus quercus]AVK75256.1 YjgF/Yer057c/UK114 family protein [Pandoravirus quercus]QBZ81429.1 YjgF/Yer057c/UK114 family protein domain containing protein [Pandoravirus celtis]
MQKQKAQIRRRLAPVDDTYGHPPARSVVAHTRAPRQRKPDGDADRDRHPVRRQRDDEHDDKRPRRRHQRRNSDGGCCYSIPTPAFAAGDVDRLGYAQAVRCGDAVWVSGTIGRDECDRLVTGGMHAQAEQVFDNLTESLKAAGCRGLEDVVHLTSYVVDIRRNIDAYVAVRARRMPDADFASATVGVVGFPTLGALVNVTCMAIPHRGCRHQA